MISARQLSTDGHWTHNDSFNFVRGKKQRFIKPSAFWNMSPVNKLFSVYTA